MGQHEQEAASAHCPQVMCTPHLPPMLTVGSHQSLADVELSNLFADLLAFHPRPRYPPGARQEHQRIQAERASGPGVKPEPGRPEADVPVLPPDLPCYLELPRLPWSVASSFYPYRPPLPTQSRRLAPPQAKAATSWGQLLFPYMFPSSRAKKAAKVPGTSPCVRPG